MVDFLLLALGITLIIVGFIGCVIPVIPGPPISFLALVTLEYSKWGPIESDLLWTLGLIAGVVIILDYIAPIWGTKKTGGSRYGLWGAAIGLFIGLFFGPLGIIIGPFVGALIGELTQNKETDKAIKAALGSLIGLLFGIVLKLSTSGLITYFFIKELFY